MPLAPESGSDDTAPALRRRFGSSAEAATLPLPPPLRPHLQSHQRDFWLRVTTFATLLGAVLTILYAWFLAQPDVLSVLTPSAFASFDRILVPLLAFTAVIGVLVLDRMATLGLVLLLAGTVFGLTGGTIWLLPGAVLGCIWAARHHRAARATLGFLLLVPGVAAVFYALLAALGVLSGLPASSLGPFAPRSLGQDLAPLEFLPLALLGAWLLVRPLDRRRKL